VRLQRQSGRWALEDVLERLIQVIPRGRELDAPLQALDHDSWLTIIWVWSRWCGV